MKNIEDISGYKFHNHSPRHSHHYLMPVVLNELKAYFDDKPNLQKRVFDLGCGNGASTNVVSENGYQVVGVDPSSEGISLASKNFPKLQLESGSAYDEDLPTRFGQFPAIMSLEVVEHLYDPKKYIKTFYDLMEPGGIGIVSTPYHGYLKNLVIALSGKFDHHVSPLWDHGHIKFWSVNTLGKLVDDAGFGTPRFHRVGRSLPALAKSMVAVFEKPVLGINNDN